MKILVTGASGLLGCNIARRLAHKGHEVTVLLRRSSVTKGVDDLSIKIAYGDLSNEKEVYNAVKDCEAVIHAASLTAGPITDYQYYKTANVIGTENIVKAAKACHVRKMVYVSTANTISPGNKDNPATEDSGFISHYNSGYILSKYVAEQYVLEQVQKEDFPAVIVNPTFMLGKYDFKPSSGQMILYGLSKKVQAFPDAGKNFIHVEDAAEGAYKALLLGKAGERYLLAGENLSYKEFFQKLNEIVGLKAVQIQIPKLIFNFAGLGGSFASKVLQKPLPLNLINARVLTLDNYYSGKKAQTELGLKLKPVEKAIKDAVEWFRETGYLKG